MKQIAKMLCIAQWKHCKNHLKIYKHRRLNIVPRSSWKTSTINDSTNDLDPTSVPKIWKLKLGVRKLKGNDIECSDLCGDQIMHFIGYIESPNAKNSCYNRKKIGTTSNARPTICVSFANKWKTQVCSAIVVRWRAQRWAKANNAPRNGSPCYVPNFNKRTMRSPCKEA